MFKREPDFIIGEKENPYLLRWWIIPRNRWFNIYLHKFLRSDDDRALHDHPWASCSIILKGGYFEIMPHSRLVTAIFGETFDSFQKIWREPGSIHFRRATAAHRVELAEGAPAWTLFITGPKIREWGFHCPKGWRHWRDFCGVPVGEAKGGEVGPGCE